MSKVTPQMVQELRQRSGVGMTKCKEALVEADGDMQKAVEILRKKGLASSVKKEGRETKEGLIGFAQSPAHIGLLEANTETDFVAKNEKFQKFVKEIAEQVAKTAPSSLEEFLKEAYDIDPSLTIDEYRNLLIQATGENIQIKRIEVITKKENCSYGIYSHMKGKIVTIVEIRGSLEESALARDIAMHVAAEDPQYLKEEDIPETVIRKEEEIARSQIKNKPENVIEKILKGKIKTFAADNCLLGQKFIKDPSMSVQEVIENKNKNLSVSCFWRWEVGSSS